VIKLHAAGCERRTQLVGGGGQLPASGARPLRIGVPLEGFYAEVNTGIGSRYRRQQPRISCKSATAVAMPRLQPFARFCLPPLSVCWCSQGLRSAARFLVTKPLMARSYWSVGSPLASLLTPLPISPMANPLPLLRAPPG